MEIKQKLLNNWLYIPFLMPFIIYVFQLLIGVSNNEKIVERASIVDNVLEFKRASGRGRATRYYLLFTIRGDDRVYGQYYEYACSVYYKPIFSELKIESAIFNLLLTRHM